MFFRNGTYTEASFERAQVRLHVPSPGDIQGILRLDVEIANEMYNSAHAQFLKPGTPRELQESAERLQWAREANSLAAKRLNEFMLHGTVPENL
jgi:hypothetical protein